MRRRVGRYIVFDAFARGGMATVHLGRLVADRGFSRLVAIKMLTSGQGSSSIYARALEDEARIASRIRHPNVVQPLDFVVDGDDLLVVMEYVHGVPLSQLIAATKKEREPMPFPVSAAIIADVLSGLHAAHEAVDERGRLLGVVHRDVSPQNVLVGADGIARLADFGIAKVMRSRPREEQTETGAVKGKLAYMPPEQLRGLPLTRQADIFSAGAVLAEALSGVGPSNDNDHADDPTGWVSVAVKAIVDPALLDVVRIATRSDPRDRFATAAEMGGALEGAVARARADIVAERVSVLAGDDLEIRSELVRRVEAEPLDDEEDDEAPVTPRLTPTPITPIQTIKVDSNKPPTIEPFEIIEPAAASASPIATVRKANRRASPRGRGLLVLCGAGIAVIGAIAYARLSSKDDPAPGVPNRPAPPVWPVAPPLTGPTASSPTPSSVTSPSSSSSPSPTTTTTPKPRPTGIRPTTSTRPAKPDCSPPFRIDADGNKHYKPECVE